MRTTQMNLKRLFSTALIIMCSTVLFAQMPQVQGQQQEVKTDFDEEKIEQFVEANLEVIKVQQKAEQEAMQIISENDLEVERFNEIVAIQQGKSDEEATEEELVAFNAAAQEIMANNQETQKEMTEVLDENGVTQQEYQQIMMAYQNDEAFRKKVDAILQEKSKG